MAEVKMNKETNFSKYREAFYNMVQGLKEILVSTDNIESDKDIEKQVAEIEKQTDFKRIDSIIYSIEKEEPVKSTKSQQREIEKRLSNPRIKSKIQDPKERGTGDDERAR